jgi:hypothetical protein
VQRNVGQREWNIGCRSGRDVGLLVNYDLLHACNCVHPKRFDAMMERGGILGRRGKHRIPDLYKHRPVKGVSCKNIVITMLYKYK